MSAQEASKTHALLEEEVGTPMPSSYHLNVEMNGSYINVFRARMIYTDVGVMVHNKPLLKNQQKFVIDEALKTNKDGFNEDVHVESFIVWDLADCEEIQQQKIQRKSSRKRGKKFREKAQKMVEKQISEDEEENEEEIEQEDRDDDWEKKEIGKGSGKMSKK